MTRRTLWPHRRDLRPMPDIIVLQRLVPHYRLPVFERLWREFGWVVATSKTPPRTTGLNLADGEYDFIRRFDFAFPDPENALRCNVPLRRILKETGAKAVISEFSLRMNSTYALVARRRMSGAPITLFWSHGYNMGRGMATPSQRLRQWPRFALARMVDGHVCYSAEGKRVLEAHIPSEQIFVAPNTLDVETQQNLARSVVPPAPPGQPSLLAVGRITEDKDFPRLIRVFLRFRERFPNAALTIVGDGPDAERTRAAAGDQLGRAIIMVGEQYHEERLAGHYLASDLVVFPGAVGLSVNHALAYGVPVLAFERTPQGPHHHPEVAYIVEGTTGRRVPDFSDAGLLEGLIAFFSEHPDPKADYAESIAHFVEQRLTLDAMVEGFAGVDAFLKARISAR
jgi:glycosyltransferase involved in cell wall biosynthesis